MRKNGPRNSTVWGNVEYLVPTHCVVAAKNVTSFSQP